jgi:hypothetical protein
MTDGVKKEIIYLYFRKMYNYDELIRHFKKKYSYSQIKTVITKYIKER